MGDEKECDDGVVSVQERPDRHSEEGGQHDQRAEQYALATVQSGSHGMRKILWNAFISSFKSEFYREGWSTHLWKIAEQIQDPDCQWLAERIRLVDERRKLPPEQRYAGLPSVVPYYDE